MNNTNETSSQLVTVAEIAAAPVDVRATKDAGRVHVGAGALRFVTTKDAGKVRIGAGALRF